MLVQMASVADAPRVEPVESAPVPEQMTQMATLLAGAKKPLAILGGSRWTQEAVNDFVRFAEQQQLPVAVQFRRQHLFPSSHPNFVGDIGLGINPKLLNMAQEADVILLVGGRMSEIASQSYTLLDIPVPKQTLIHVHPDSQELNRVYQAALAINATPARFGKAAVGLAASSQDARKNHVDAAHAAYLEWSNPQSVNTPGALQMGKVMEYLESHLEPDAILTNGAGNYATWLHRFHRFNHFNTQLAPTSGSMGYGAPAAVGAKRVMPQRQVVCFAGDGCFLMHGQEFATAVQYGLNIIVLVFDNGMYGTIRMHQEKHYPGRVSATNLQNPDFAAYAVAFGGHGERVEKNDDFGPAFERAVASGKPAILHCLIDPQAITPTATLDQLRAAAEKSQSK